mmetsp:Transcript_1567/g.2041  ORF Transcript_1567/g.2041 Transcript_1567/m.2041 type:complete len:134 (+) Transcript_1567:20-421(+)
MNSQITEEMIKNWIRGSGYVNSPNSKYQYKKNKPSTGRHHNVCSRKEPLPRSGSIICVNTNGSIIQKKLPGRTTWQYLQEDVPSSQLKNIQVQTAAITEPATINKKGTIEESNKICWLCKRKKGVGLNQSRSS